MTNEAAERLRRYLDDLPTADLDGLSEIATLDAALAAERRAGAAEELERIRAKITEYDGSELDVSFILAILDAEASR